MPDSLHPKHAKAHELIGAAVAILSIVLLMAFGFEHPDAWNQVLFNVSIIVIAFYWPLKDYFRYHKGPVEHIYWIVLVAISALVSAFLAGIGVEPSFADAFWNPATINFLIGATFVMIQAGFDSAESIWGKLVWGLLMIAFVMTAIYTAAPHMPAGPAQDAAMGVRSVMDATVVPLVVGTGEVTWTCVGSIQLTYGSEEYTVGQMWEETFDPNTMDVNNPVVRWLVNIPPGGEPGACQQRIARFASVLEGIIPAPLWDILSYLTGKVFGYVNGMACIGGQGGFSSVFFNHPGIQDPSVDREDTGSNDVKNCFVSEDTSDDDPGGDNSQMPNLHSLKVDGGRATLSLSAPYPEDATTTGWDMSGPSAQVLLDGADKNGRTYNLYFDGGELSSGDEVIVSGPVGSCSDTYGDGDSSGCIANAPSP